MLSFKREFGQASHAGFQAKEVTREGVARLLLWRQIDKGRGDVEFVEVRTSENTTRRTQYRHRDDALNLPAGSEAYDFGAIPITAPDAALAIDREAIGHARLIGQMHKSTTISNRTGLGIKIVGVDNAERGIGEIHHRIVRAPANAIGDPHIRLHRMDRAIGVQAIEHANR